MRIRILAIACSLAATAAAADIGTDLRERAKQLIVSAARDPGSVEFRNVVSVVDPAPSAPLGVVCGEANAANADGGRTGFGRFVVVFSRELDEPPWLVTAEDGAERLALAWRIRCETISRAPVYGTVPSTQ